MQINDEKIDNIRRIARDHGVRLVLLFGSAVTGKTHPGSDLDIAVMFADSEAARAGVFDLMAEVQDVFPDREVDLALINGADPLFLKKILENCELLFGEPRTLAELKMYAFRRYIDHKRYLKMEGEYIKRLLDKFEKGAA